MLDKIGWGINHEWTI